MHSRTKDRGSVVFTGFVDIFLTVSASASVVVAPFAAVPAFLPLVAVAARSVPAFAISGIFFVVTPMEKCTYYS